MNLILCKPDFVLENWNAIKPFLEQAMSHSQNESSITDYMKKILTLTAQCWVIQDGEKIVGVGLTQILSYAQHKTLHIMVLACHDLEKYTSLFGSVESFAKAQGCIAIEQWGRKGWAKALPKYVPGFEEAYVVMRKPIQELKDII